MPHYHSLDTGRVAVLKDETAVEVGVDWGDGSPRERFGPDDAGGPVLLSHEFAADGVYTIRTRTVGIDGGVAFQRFDAIIALSESAGLVLSGGAGDDLILGGLADDTLAGGRDRDKLFGSSGDDALRGGDGADTLIGGIGDDTLAGGADLWSDLFVLDAMAEGVDRIRDFDPLFDGLRLVFVAPGTPLVADLAPVAPGPGQWLLYDTDSGLLAFDIDGDGASAPIPLAILIGAPALTDANLSFGPVL